METPAPEASVDSCFPCLFVVLEPSKDWWGWISFTQCTTLNANLPGKALIETPRNNISPAVWASLVDIKLTIPVTEARPKKPLYIIAILVGDHAKSAFLTLSGRYIFD